MQNLKYYEAINQTLHQILMQDKRVVILGSCCLNSPWYVGKTLEGLLGKFPSQIIDCPVSENAVTGMAVGMAIAGMRPIVVFPRMDFMLYAMDPIINQAAKWHFMFGGRAKVPIVFWSIINRGGSQGCQHSQDLRWIFEKIPGLLCCSGLTLREAVQNDNPCVFFDNRDLYDLPVNEDGMFSGHKCWGTPMPASEKLEAIWFRRYGR